MGSKNNMVAVPEGMKPWYGGEHAPADWAGSGSRTIGRLGQDLNPGAGPIYWRWATDDDRSDPDLDIVAYTPARLASAQPDAQQGEGVLWAAIDAGKRFLADCNAAWAAGEPSHRVRTMLDSADKFQTALDSIDVAPSSPALDAATIERVRASLRAAHDLLMSIKQTNANVWWVDAEDPEMAVCGTFSAVEDALDALPNAEKRHG